MILGKIFNFQRITIIANVDDPIYVIIFSNIEYDYYFEFDINQAGLLLSELKLHMS